MKTTEIVREIMRDRGVSLSQLSKTIGKSQSLVCNRIAQNNISVDKLQEVLSALGYKIFIVPVDYTLADDMYEVSASHSTTEEGDGENG